VPYRTPVHFANASAAGAGTTKDISSAGMFMETHSLANVGDRISIAFQFRNSRHPMDLEGEIARRTHDGVGIKFLWS
jgi:hypothetical protein